MSVVVELWSDGSGGRAGYPIGYAWVLLAIDADTGVVVHEAKGQGAEVEGTNNRAELLAVIHGLMQLRFRSKVKVVTDSEYVARNAVHSLPMWQQTGWRLTSATRSRADDDERDLMCALCGQPGAAGDVCTRHGGPFDIKARRDGRAVVNRDLWIALADQLEIHTVTFEHVKGHTGLHYNEDCDERAGQARKALVAELQNQAA